MPSNNENTEAATWPVPQFRFEVDFGNELNSVSFQEVSGMDVETQIIEYRKTNSPIFSTEKMPGITKYGSITMKKGVFVNDNRFWDWHAQIIMNAIKKRTITIKLLDENGKVAMQWTLTNAWPTKITSTDLKSDGNEIAIETIEIANEGLTVSNG